MHLFNHSSRHIQNIVYYFNKLMNENIHVTAVKESHYDKQLKEEEKILESIAERKGITVEIT